MNRTLPVIPSTSNHLEIFALHPKGLAVRSKKFFLPGEVITHLEGPILPGPTRFSIRYRNEHYDTEPPLRFVNHSCSPNAVWNGNQLQAMTHIDTGEEITFDYLETENEISSPFICQCGSSQCRGTIGRL